MKFTLSWLKEYLDMQAGIDEIAAKLTAIGLEVEQVIDNSKTLEPFIVAEVLEAEKHLNADKLKVCKVNNGTEELQIVCGAANARAGLKVVLAQVGTLIPNGNFQIKAAEIRGVKSNGMLCSADELNLGKDAEGIIELPKDAKVGDKAAKWLGAGEPVIEIAITPNRGDCLGVYGVARDLAAAGLGKLKSEGVTTEDFQEVVDQGKFDSPVTVSIKGTKNCSYFIGRTVKGVKNGPSPAWLAQRLEAIGLRPISALVDITNYITYGFGRPSHVYDANKLKGNITVSDSKGGEKLAALDDKTYKLDKGMCVITDDSGVIGLGGVIGGEPTGCDENTSDVFLEVALFDPISIATTGRKLQIDSDARYRFERGVAPSTLKHFITLTNLITEICGGEISKPTIAGSIDIKPKTVDFNPERVKSLIGIEPKDKEIKDIFASLGFEVKGSGKKWQVKIPSFRFDIEQEADLVEEIARIYGYDKIPATPMPKDNIIAILTPSQQKVVDVRNTLSARGMTETVTFSFISSKQAGLFGAANDNVLANPISSDLDAMRPSIIPSLLEALQKNEARGYNSLVLFEVGPIFAKASIDGQQICAAGVRSGDAVEKNVHGDAREVDLFDAKADAFAALAHYIDPTKLTITRDVPAWYHPGKSGALLLGKQVLGYFGELHPSIVSKFDIESGAVAAFEIFPQKAPQPKDKKGAARAKLEISNYQAVNRDFAFVVDENVTAADILKAVNQAEKNLIESVDIFDVYAGKGIEQGKKSVAFSIRLQPKDRTLTDAEIEAVSKAVVDNVQKSVGGVLRN